MTPLITHDQVEHAIVQALAGDGVAQVVRDIVLPVLTIHRAEPPESMRPVVDCLTCHGLGVVEIENDDADFSLEHCHCVCPWCSGCEEPLCLGACPTVAAIAKGLGLIRTEG